MNATQRASLGPTKAKKLVVKAAALCQAAVVFLRVFHQGAGEPRRLRRCRHGSAWAIPSAEEKRGRAARRCLHAAGPPRSARLRRALGAARWPGSLPLPAPAASRASGSLRGGFVRRKLCFNPCWIYPDASVSGRLTRRSGLLRARSLDFLIWKGFIQN